MNEIDTIRATDKRGRNWEIFRCLSFYDMYCVRPITELDFNSPLAFRFATKEKAIEFLKLIAQSY